MSHSESRIRAACDKLGWYPSKTDQLIRALRNQEDLAHLFTDADTVTKKEIMDAWSRYRQYPPGAAFTVEWLLRDISEHREPEYPLFSVWQDAESVIWQRSAGSWLRMGASGAQPHDAPKRPLTRLETQ